MNDDPPYLPGRNLGVERAVGRFIIAWGALEREIDSAIHDLLLTNLRTGVVVTANLALRAKLDLAHALFEELRSEDDSIWRPISKEWERRFDKLVSATEKANTEHRIPIVHSQPQVISLPSGDRPFWMRMAARKGGLRGSGETYTKASLEKRTVAIVELVNEWAAARAHWKHAVHAMRSAEADEWLNRSPDTFDDLTFQLHPRDTSAKARPKRTQGKQGKLSH